MDNYFDFYGIPVKYHIDQNELRRVYLEQSRAHHPDYHQMADAGGQSESLDQSSLNNAAFDALKDPVKRLEHILQLYNFIDENKENLTETQPEQMFLMDMMERNEAVEEAGKEQNTDALQDSLAINSRELSLLNDKIEELMRDFDAPVKSRPQTDVLRDVFRLYLERKYLLRLKDLIHTFVS